MINEALAFLGGFILVLVGYAIGYIHGHGEGWQNRIRFEQERSE